MSQPTNTFFTKDFQIALIANMARDEDLFRTTSYLKLTDIDMEPCRLVLETLRDYWRQFNSLPDFGTLQLHLQYMVQNMHNQTQTILMPEDFEALAYVMGEIVRSYTVPANPAYYKQQLPAYIKQVRVSQEVAAFQGKLTLGQGATDFVQSISSINEEIGRSGDIVLDNIDENPEAMTDKSTFVRVPTVLEQLNHHTSGGLGLGESGMIVACPGVGKTTGLINFMDGAVNTGFRSLFLTLELRAHRIKHRFHSIAAHIPAQYFKLPVTEWPPHILQRYQMQLDPRNKRFGMSTIVDMSKRRFTVDDIDQAIQMWLEETARKNQDASMCRAVFIDWLDRIDPSNLQFNKNTRDDQILTRVSESLGELSRKHDMALWTATQGTRGADGKDILQMGDTAWGYHKNDAVDVSLGIGVTHDAAVKMADDGVVRNDDEDIAPPCNRNLTMSIMKNRDNPTAVLDVYQGATLRFYDKKTNEHDTMKLLNEGKLEQVFEMRST